MAGGEKQLLAAASMLLDSSRNMEHVVSVLESMSAEQSALLERLTDKIDAIGKKDSIGKQIKDLGKGGQDVATALKGFAEAIPLLSKSLMKFAVVPKSAKTGFTEFIWHLYQNMSGGQGSKKKSSKEVSNDWTSFGNAFTKISGGLADLSIGLILFSIVPKSAKGDEKAQGSFINFISNISKHFTKTNPKKIKAGAEATKDMAKSIFLFGVSLAASTVFYAIGAVGSLIIIPLIAGYAYMFSILGEKTLVKKVEAGAKALAWMGVGLVSFALGLFAVKELAGGDWGEFAKGSLIVILGATVFSFLFYELGEKEHAERVETGAKAMVFVGIALASLALGIWAFQALNVGLVPVLMAGLAVAVVGLAFGIAGKFSKEIKEGAASLFFSGIALASLALGLWVFQKMDIGIGTVLMAGLAVGVLGLLFGIAGMVAGEIALGALAFLAVALAVIAIGYGFEQFKKNKIGLEDIGLVSGALIAVGLIMTGAGITSIFMLAGAASMIATGFALSSIAQGLKDFKGINYTDADAEMITKVVGSLASAFSVAGGASANAGGVLGWLTGIDIGTNTTEKGIKSMLHAGDALSSMAKGLVEFKKLNLGDDTELWTSVKLTVAGLGDAFASMGKGHAAKPGLLGFLGVETTDTEMGILSVLKSGDALTSIAKGLLEFGKLKMNLNVGPDAGDDSIPNKIISVVSAISTVFGMIGSKKAVPDTGLMGAIFGSEENPVKVGIDSVHGVGKDLMEIADGLKKFGELKGLNLTMLGEDSIPNKIVAVVTTISTVFGMIGSKTQMPSGGFFGTLFGSKENPVKIGIDSVHGVGKDLMEIADSLKKFSDLKGMNLTLVGEDSIPNKILQVVSTISTVFGMIGSKAQMPSGGIFGTLFGAKDNSVKVGIDSIKGVGEELNKIAASVKIFSDVKDIDKIQKNITSIITSVPAAFLLAYKTNMAVFTDVVMNQIKSFTGILSRFINVLKDVPADADKKGTSLSDTFTKISSGLTSLGNLKEDSVEKAVSFMERLAKTSDPLIKLADSFERIAKSMDKFSDVFRRMNPQNVKTSDLLIQSLVAFSKADPNAFSTLTDKGKALISFIYEKGADKGFRESPATQPEPSMAMHNEPGKKEVEPAAAYAPMAPTKKEVANNQMNQMMTDLTENMSGMASALKDIKTILQGTLKVSLFNG